MSYQTKGNIGAADRGLVLGSVDDRIESSQGRLQVCQHMRKISSQKYIISYTVQNNMHLTFSNTSIIIYTDRQRCLKNGNIPKTGGGQIHLNLWQSHDPHEIQLT